MNADHRTDGKWGRGHRGPKVIIHAEAATRAGALAHQHARPGTLLAVLDGPSPTWLVVTLDTDRAAA